MAVEETSSSETHFLVSDRMPQDSGAGVGGSAKPVSRVTVVWDTSGSRGGIEHAKELKALEAYFASPVTKQFAGERKTLGLDALLKMDRNWGTLEAAVDA